jgi:hypothetical protein
MKKTYRIFSRKGSRNIQAESTDDAMKIATDIYGLNWHRIEQVFFLSVSDCPPERTTYQFETLEEAQEAKRVINESGCGHQCVKAHRIVIRTRRVILDRNA